jgi:error-prone DNA polymerase
VRAEPGDCRRSSGGIAFIAWPEDLDAFEASCRGLREALRQLPLCRASCLYRGADAARIERLDRMARSERLHDPATNDVHYHVPDRRPLQDIMTCIREKVTIAMRAICWAPMPSAI